MQRDLNWPQWLDELHYDEFWVGEHHSAGWETIASPEMFLVAAAERTKRIKLGTGVVSIPYHHPFNVAQRIVMLDHLSHGRAMLGVGPGALPSDAFMLGIDPMTQRDRMDEGLGVILRLLTTDEPFSYKGSWFELNNAALQIRPLQEKIPVAVASTISPSGMKMRGQVRRRRAVGRVVLRRRADGAADAVEFRRDLGEGHRQHDRSQRTGES